jgi:hypothetical protein
LRRSHTAQTRSTRTTTASSHTQSVISDNTQKPTHDTQRPGTNRLVPGRTLITRHNQHDKITACIRSHHMPRKLSHDVTVWQSRGTTKKGRNVIAAFSSISLLITAHFSLHHTRLST